MWKEWLQRTVSTESSCRQQQTELGFQGKHKHYPTHQPLQTHGTGWELHHHIPAAGGGQGGTLRALGDLHSLDKDQTTDGTLNGIERLPIELQVELPCRILVEEKEPELNMVGRFGPHRPCPETQ